MTSILQHHYQILTLLAASVLPWHEPQPTSLDESLPEPAEPASSETVASKAVAIQSAEDTGDGLRAALTGGRAWLNLRYRVEEVDQDTFAKDALASTLRTVLGYETGVYHGFQALVEFEDVTPIGRDNYNSTTNGVTDRPVVADPDGSEVNQAYLQYVGHEGLVVRIGRQEIVLDNHRFIGNVGWRQNHQSYDAATLVYEGIPNTKVTYGYIQNVNRIFGDASPMGDFETTAHILNAGHDIDGVGKLSAYLYYLDFKDAQALSTATYGLRFSGGQSVSNDVDILYTGEYADQHEVAKNPNDVDANYYLAEAGVAIGGFTLKFANEHLGGSGNVGDAFSTPLATLHKFNGYADLFLTTPDTGLEDRNVSLSKHVAGVNCAVTYHVFESDSGNIDYGSEVDVTLIYPASDHVTVGVKYAHYNKDQFSTDTSKVIGWVSFAVL